MRIIAKKTLKTFWEKHPDAENALKNWYNGAAKASWQNPNKIKDEYPYASILPDSRVVFNIKGNEYRLMVRINYDYSIVWIRFIGNHAEYDKIQAAKI